MIISEIKNGQKASDVCKLLNKKIEQIYSLNIYIHKCFIMKTKIANRIDKISSIEQSRAVNSNNRMITFCMDKSNEY